MVRKKFISLLLIPLLSLLTVVNAFAQQVVVTGQVTDNSNFGMPGVNVQVKGTTTGVITDIDGNYSITVPSSKSVLVFSFVGYSTQEIQVKNQTKINVLLKEDTQALDEVVVVGMGTQKRSTITAAVATVDQEAIVNRSG